MRVWDVHPGYLSRQSLLGQHVEIHAIYSVLSGGRKGYARHPETLRWKNRHNALLARHDLTVKEMLLRGYNHASVILRDKNPDNDEKMHYVDKPARQFTLLQKKYIEKNVCGRIPLPKNGSAFWSHYKYSVMGRGYQYYKEVQKFLNNHKDFPIEEESDLIELVLSYMEKAPTDKSLRNVMNHLWGYFKDVSSNTEREYFGSLKQKSPGTQLAYLYSLAQKYKLEYLLHSTLFSDFVT